MNRLQEFYLMVLMRDEAEQQVEVLEAEFTNNLFLHRPEVYEAMYGNEAIEAEVDYVTPDSGDEFTEMLNEMKAMGLITG